jgi:predicted short-subunit dehydrogenase-like oxidoreductase (DUF2520 family)
MISIQNISIVGSGNTANFFANKLAKHGFNILQIISRNEQTGQLLASQLNANFDKTYFVDSASQLVLLCVPDDQISECAVKLRFTNNAIVCHCAGSVEMQVLNTFENYGVVYPLQSLSKSTPVDEIDVPFLIESNKPEVLEAIQSIIKALGLKSYLADSNVRLNYHLAAVFANNFTNAMLIAVEKLSHSHQLDFNLFRPLIKRTIEKIELLKPIEAQTGPAVRNDIVTINKHLALLKENPELLSVYKTITNFIQAED